MSSVNKDFLEWHKVKSNINASDKKVFFHEREIWMCSVGLNVGFEQDGKGNEFARPVLIFKQYNLDIFLALPLTSRSKPSLRTNKFYKKINIDGVESFVILSQLRLFDKKRLIRKMGIISVEEFLLVKNSLLKLL